MMGFLVSMGITGVLALAILRVAEKSEGKDKIVLELDNRYNRRKDMIKATVNKLEKKGKKCRCIGEDKIEVDGEGYIFTERDYTMGRLPLQQIILKHI